MPEPEPRPEDAAPQPPAPAPARPDDDATIQAEKALDAAENAEDAWTARHEAERLGAVPWERVKKDKDR